jgi:hypothetical protein
LMARRLLNADQATPAGQATGSLSAAEGALTRPWRRPAAPHRRPTGRHRRRDRAGPDR